MCKKNPVSRRGLVAYAGILAVLAASPPGMADPVAQTGWSLMNSGPIDSGEPMGRRNHQAGDQPATATRELSGRGFRRGLRCGPSGL